MPNPKLPPILINKAGSVYYVYTYKNIWDRELKRSKRGESKKIGTILGGQKEGKIRFDEAFQKCNEGLNIIIYFSYSLHF